MSRSRSSYIKKQDFYNPRKVRWNPQSKNTNFYTDDGVGVDDPDMRRNLKNRSNKE